MEKKKFKIWYQTRDEEGNVIGIGVCTREYCYYGTAHNAAHKRFGDRKDVNYRVAVLNPFIEHLTDVVCAICGKTYSAPVDAEFGHVISGHHIHIRSSDIPTGDSRRWYSKSYDTCSDCAGKINNFIESLKEKPTIRTASNACEAMCMDD